MTDTGPHQVLPTVELTERQAKLLRLRAAGTSRTRLAHALHTNTGRITTHLNELHALLGASSRAQLAGLALVRGLVQPGEVISRQVPQPVRISERQHELLVLFAAGANDQTAATAMSISAATVRAYSSGLLSKVGAHERAHAVALGLVYGLLTVNAVDPTLPALPLADYLARQDQHD